MKKSRTLWRRIGAFTVIAIIGLAIMACGTATSADDPRVYHTITFITNGGSAIAPVRVPNGQPLTRPTTPTRSGHNFAGWHSDAELTTPFGFATPITGPTTLYARWFVFVSDQFTALTGWEMMGRLGMGINIGNAMEASGDWFTGCPITEMEIIWGAARIEQWHFAAIAAKGFNTVRLPVNWGPRMDDNWNIDGAWMNRVQEVVDWALAEDLYVIINTHHVAVLYALLNERRLDEAENWLRAVWGQIADRFKYYPERLIFEPMNEPRPGIDGWYWDPVAHRDRIHSLALATNRLNHAALDFIRGSGGHNAQRIVKLVTVQADANIIYTYEHPADDPYVMLGTFFYPGREENQLEQISAALNKGIPIVIKETSPLHDPNAPMTTAEMLAWSRRVYEGLASLGVPSIWWNTGGYGPDQLLCRATGRWVNIPQLEIFFAAYGARLGPGMTPPPLFPFELASAVEGTGFNNWNFPTIIKDLAEAMVVEFEGTIDSGFMFARWTAEDGWMEYSSGHGRITIEPGRLILDIRGLSGNNVHFALWGENDVHKVTRIYLTGPNP